MGYFSNGTEGECYEDEYCARCIHYDGCAVLLLHMIHNYKESNKEDSFLHILIPRSKNRNLKCNMFFERGKR